MTYNELKQSVGWGEEYNFYLNDEEIWISHNEDGYYLTREDGTYQEFKTSEELFQKGRINNKTILELWDDINGQF